MTKPYAMELRERAVRFVNAGESRGGRAAWRQPILRDQMAGPVRQDR